MDRIIVRSGNIVRESQRSMNRIIVWIIACFLPLSVLWATDGAKTCTSFSQQGRQVTFHLADSAALQLQLCIRSKNILLAQRAISAKERFFCRHQ